MAQISVPIKIDGLDFVIKLMKDLVERTDFKEDLSDDYKNGFYDFSNAVITTLEKLNDGDSVQHGHWITTDNSIFECSNCNYQFEHEGYKHFFNYCPCCGAKMDGDTE